MMLKIKGFSCASNCNNRSYRLTFLFIDSGPYVLNFYSYQAYIKYNPINGFAHQRSIVNRKREERATVKGSLSFFGLV